MADSSAAGGEAQQEWRRIVLAYADGWRQYAKAGEANGWTDCGPEPEMAPSEHLLVPWRSALEAINQKGVSAAERAQFRHDWPPAHAPLIPLLMDEGQSISSVALLDDGTVLARIGAYYETGRVVRINGDRVDLISGVDLFGRCPARRYFAVANDAGIAVTDGWEGPQVARMKWPTGLENLPPGFVGEELHGRPCSPQIIPFPDGKRVLLLSREGIFVISELGACRVLPNMAEIEEDGELWGLDMEHGAVSPDGKWIAVGHQTGRHRVLHADLTPAAWIGPESEYPHFALFSNDSKMLILNACHFENGSTLGVSVDDLPGLDTDYYSGDPRTPVLQETECVYAGVHRGTEFIIGDASGCLRAFSETGEPNWHQLIGSTVDAIDVARDGKTLVVSTCAGFLSTFALDAGNSEPWQIGDGPHKELQRWIFWRSMDKPLLW